jgi:hypothetical protein
MVLITLAGLHGVGKTTAVNNYVPSKLLIKYLNTDVIPIDGVGFRQQMIRLGYMSQIFSMLPVGFDVIIDRSPGDFIGYNLAVLSSQEERDVAGVYTDHLLNWYSKLNMEKVNLLVFDDLESIWNRIVQRNQNRWNELDRKYVEYMYDFFYSEDGKKYKMLTGISSTFVHVDDLEKIFDEILHEKT